MKKFDFLLTRDKEHYIEQIDLHTEKTKVSRILDAILSAGKEELCFERRSEEICGAYVEPFPIIRNGRFYVTFKGRFERDGDGKMHFRGMIVPPIIHLVIYLLLLISIIVFAPDNIAAWVLFSVFFAFFAFVTVKLIIEAYRSLREFFK